MTEKMINPNDQGGPAWYRRHWVHLVGVGLVGLFFGIGAGAGAQPEPVTEIVAGPSVTVTPEPEPAVTVTAKAETTTVETEVVKPECLEALNAADDFIMQTADLLGGPVSGMFGAASEFDFDAMDKHLDDFNDQADDLLVTQSWYVSASAVCRG